MVIELHQDITQTLGIIKVSPALTSTCGSSRDPEVLQLRATCPLLGRMLLRVRLALCRQAAQASAPGLTLSEPHFQRKVFIVPGFLTAVSISLKSVPAVHLHNEPK